MHRSVIETGSFELLIDWHAPASKLSIRAPSGMTLNVDECELLELLTLLQRGAELLTRRRQEEILEAINSSLL